MLRVAHVGLRVPDLDRSVAHAEDVLGLRVSERADGVVYLTCNERHHELVLVAGDAVACDHVAFEVLGRDAYEATCERVAAAGLEVIARGPLEPGVADAIRFVAPGGLVVEVLYGMADDQPRRYDTSAPRPVKFEHITVKSTCKPALEAVLVDVLGLRMSDMAEDAVSWLRAGEEHHGVSVIAADSDGLHHYAWTIDAFATFARIGDHLMEHGSTFLWGPGHHGIGDNYFCYAYDADGVIVEYSAGMQRVEHEDTYEARVWPDVPLSVNRWGNPPPPAEFQAAITPFAVLAATP